MPRHAGARAHCASRVNFNVHWCWGVDALVGRNASDLEVGILHFKRQVLMFSKFINFFLSSWKQSFFIFPSFLCFNAFSKEGVAHRRTLRMIRSFLDSFPFMSHSSLFEGRTSPCSEWDPEIVMLQAVHRGRCFIHFSSVRSEDEAFWVLEVRAAWKTPGSAWLSHRQGDETCFLTPRKLDWFTHPMRRKTVALRLEGGHR